MTVQVDEDYDDGNNSSNNNDSNNVIVIIQADNDRNCTQIAKPAI